jgi:hypothetical protein
VSGEGIEELPGVSGDCDELLDFIKARVSISNEGRSRALPFLGAFAKLRKGSSCLSVRMEQLGSHRTDFYETRYLSVFRNSVEKIQVSLKSNKYHMNFT